MISPEESAWNATAIETSWHRLPEPVREQIEAFLREYLKQNPPTCPECEAELNCPYCDRDITVT